MKLMLSPTKTRELISILGALSLFLALLEHIIPKPIPFVRLGLANIPIIISLILLTPKQTLMLIFIKSIGSSIVTGTIFSWIFLYSLAGSISSGLIMILVYIILKKRVSMIGISVLGALASNLVQILVATLLLGSGAKYIGLPILVTGLVTGIAIGVLTNNFISNSKWIRSLILET
ncbi:MAG: Gx transporter family protein [Spirochaetaceae bacterium]